MEVQVTTAVVAASAAVVVAAAGHLFNGWVARQQGKRQVNSEYLNPLRLYAEETYFRLYELKFRSEAHSWLLAIQEERELSDQEDTWFSHRGCYLISTCYFTACLFGTIARVRSGIPYMRLGRNTDTELLRLTFLVSKSFLRDRGVYYALQHNLGNEMYKDGRLLSYGEFCLMLKEPRTRVWFDRLIRFYLEVGMEKERAFGRVDSALEAIWNLSAFTDQVVRGGKSIETRLVSERKLCPPSLVKRALRLLSGNRIPKTPNPALNRPETALSCGSAD
jgi:hypothetical protein